MSYTFQKEKERGGGGVHGEGEERGSRKGEMMTEIERHEEEEGGEGGRGTEEE